MEPLFKKNVGSHSSFTLKNTIGQSFDGLWHFHSEFELIYIWEGRGEKIIGDNVSQLNKGDLLLLGSDLPHLFSCDQDFPMKHKAGSLVVHMRKEFLTSCFLNIPELQPVRELILKSRSGLQFNGDSEQIAQRMERMFKMNRTECLFEIFSILNSLSKHDNYEQLASQGYAPGFNKRDYQRINKACKYVMDNFNQEISLDDVTEIVGLTKAAFCRYFKKVTGKTFFTYIKEYRIGQACKLLMETNLNITEIGYKCGFNTISNFNKQFKEIMDTNPSTYRERFLKPLYMS